jgi:hypothetical protein
MEYPRHYPSVGKPPVNEFPDRGESDIPNERRSQSTTNAVAVDDGRSRQSTASVAVDGKRGRQSTAIGQTVSETGAHSIVSV